LVNKKTYSFRTLAVLGKMKNHREKDKSYRKSKRKKNEKSENERERERERECEEINCMMLNG